MLILDELQWTSENFRMISENAISKGIYSGRSLSIAAGVPENMLSRLKTDAKNPSLFPVVAICKASGTSLDDMYDIIPRHREAAETIALDTTVMVQEEKLRSAKELSLSQERIIRHQENRIKHLITAIIILGCMLFLSMVYAIIMDQMVPHAGIFQYTISETQ